MCVRTYMVAPVHRVKYGVSADSKKLRIPDGSKFRCVSAGLFRLETCKMKMKALFRVSAALPLT